MIFDAQFKKDVKNSFILVGHIAKNAPAHAVYNTQKKREAKKAAKAEEAYNDAIRASQIKLGLPVTV